MATKLAKPDLPRAHWLAFYQALCPDVAWRLNPRLRSTLGRYMPRRKVIEISTRHLLNDSAEAVYETICHEYAHHLAWLEGVRGHAPRWRQLMSQLSGLAVEDVRATTSSVVQESDYRWRLVWLQGQHVVPQQGAWFRRPKRDARYLMLRGKPESLGQLRYAPNEALQAWQQGQLATERLLSALCY
ncbi:SprT-like domain-containing protein [Salinibius halmophilus]|uniref:SprT-like domain-containing protein n=1 Tax=Salinibius halmophilus TaxID=1853216 RepID=UPI000E664A34|nr:SprT-like domain-containing protein [Salinibius halmophilus]